MTYISYSKLRSRQSAAKFLFYILRDMSLSCLLLVELVVNLKHTVHSSIIAGRLTQLGVLLLLR